MRTILDAKQTAHFTKTGSIEFELPHPAPAIDPALRDQWRQNKKLEEFLIRKLGPLALALTNAKQLRLALDQVFTKENRPTKSGPLKDQFNIQNLVLAIAISPNPIIPEQRSQLGILPLPTTAQNLLFFRPELILDWPHTTSDLYLAFFAAPNAVYIHNPRDPHSLKQFGYQYGDVLRNESHPLIL